MCGVLLLQQLLHRHELRTRSSFRARLLSLGVVIKVLFKDVLAEELLGSAFGGPLNCGRT